MKKRTRLFAFCLALVAAIPIAALPISASSETTPPPGLLESQVGMEIMSGYPKYDSVQWRNPNGDNIFYSFKPPCFLLNNLLDGIDNRKHYGICCQSEAAAGVSKEKFGINLDAMEKDSKGWYLKEYETRRDIKWIFKVFYYATKKSTWEYFESKGINTSYQFLVAVSLAYRREGKANKIPYDSTTNGSNLKYVAATNYLIDLAANDADKIGNKIQVGSGIAWLDISGDHYAVMCIYNPQDKSSTSQRMIVFTPDTWAEKGSITVNKKDQHGHPLQGAMFRVRSASNPLSFMDITTNAQGIATTGIESLDLGKYTVIETKMPDGCRAVTAAEAKTMGGYLNSSGQLCFDVEVSAQKNTLNITLQATNRIRAGIGIKKVSSNHQPLAGALFGVFTTPTATVPLATAFSDDKGIAFFDEDAAYLIVGETYYFREIAPPNGYYILDENAIYEMPYRGVTEYYHNGYDYVINYPYGVPTGVATHVKLYAVLLSATTVTLIGAALIMRRKKAAKS